MSEQVYGQPLIITDSGGKDSSVCKRLAEIAKINYEILHNHTTADAPETFFFLQSEFRRLENMGVKCTREMPVYKGKRTSMWDLIRQNMYPPTRLARYCCKVLKERGGAKRFIVTGVRWAESTKRKNNRGIYETVNAKKEKRVILNNDNDEKRRLFENCTMKAKRICNPIIDWTDDDVWSFIEDENIPINQLYSEGMTRVGCIGCPMATKKRKAHFERWPKYKNCYMIAFEKMLEERKKHGKETTWQTAQEVFDWWMEEKRKLPGQIRLTDTTEEVE